MTNRFKFSKNNFIHTNSQILEGDNPYDALVVNRINNNNDYLYETDGSVVSCDWTVGNPAAVGEDDSFTFTRPYCMASGWASIMQIPWLIQPGLNKIILTLDYRVSTGSIDNAGTSPWTTPTVDVCMRLADHSGVSNVVSLETTKNEFKWAGEGSGNEIVFEIDSGSFSRDPGLGPFYTILNLCIRSRGMDLSAATIATDSHTNFGPDGFNEKIIYNAADPFVDPLTNWPTSDSPWISGVAVKTDAGASRHTGPFDIISKPGLGSNPDDFAYIYGDSLEQLSVRGNKIEINVFEIPYIQIRNYVIREEYLAQGENV
ncbi:MAG: hypothetical protein ACR2MR_13525 [Dietzia maris]